MRNQNLIEKLQKVNEVEKNRSTEFEILNPHDAMSFTGGEAPECTTKCFINICRTNCGQDCSNNTCCPNPSK